MFQFPPDFNILENDSSFDLDIFLFDSSKIIHIATGGMHLINSLRGVNIQNYNTNLRNVLAYRRVFNYESNKQLDRDNLTTLDNYLYFFNIMSKRGFYSYDKVDINNSDDYNFQLISKPTYHKKLIINNSIEFGNIESRLFLNYNLDFLRAKQDFPEDFKIFDLREYV